MILLQEKARLELVMATGLNNIGLYVKVWGRVSIVGGKYKLDDGSGTDVTIQVTSGTIANNAYISAKGSCPARRMLVVS